MDNTTKAAYEAMSYRELQGLAKVLKIPANLKKQYLIELILAQNNKDQRLVKSIVKTALMEREESIKGKTKKTVPIRSSPGSEVRLNPKEPYVSLNSSQIYNTRQTRSKNKTRKPYPIVQCSPLPLTCVQMADSSIKRSICNGATEENRTMTSARTNIVPEDSLKNGVRAVSTTRKNATVLETLLQAPMTSKLEEIAADCSRKNDEVTRTVRIVGDSEAKKAIAAIVKMNIPSSESQVKVSPTDNFTMNPKTITSEVTDIKWSRNASFFADDNPSTSADQFSRPNTPFGYQEFAANSSDHDHQYRIPDGEANFGQEIDQNFSQEVDSKEAIIRPDPPQEESLEDEFAPDHFEATEDSKSGQQIIANLQEPLRRSSFERMGFNVDYSNDETNIYVEVCDYSAGQNNTGNNPDDFYNDSGVQELDNYYGLPKNDGDISPRTYNSILSEYLNMPDISEQTNDAYPVLPNQSQGTTHCALTNNNIFLEEATQQLTQDNNSLQQELMHSGDIQDTTGQNDYPVVSIEGNGIGESEYDPLTTALTLNFQNYDSLGLSPPHSDEMTDQEVSRRVSELTRVWRRYSHREVCGAAMHVLCFLCNHVGKVADLEDHLRKDEISQSCVECEAEDARSEDIRRSQRARLWREWGLNWISQQKTLWHESNLLYLTKHPHCIKSSVRGMMTLVVDVRALASDLFPLKQQILIEHRDRLYVLRFSFKPPDTIQAIILAIPPKGQVVMEEPLPVLGYIQAMDPVTGDETVWQGFVECINQAGRLTDEEVFSNRMSGRFQVMLRDIHMVPPVIHDADVNLEGVFLSINAMVRTLNDIVEMEIFQDLPASSSPVRV